VGDHPIRLVVTDELSRERLTVFFRWLLSVPHFIWIGLWGIAVIFGAVLNWLATLVLGRSPRPLHNFLAAYVKYATQLYAYLNLAANPYPPFDGQPGYPVDVTIAPPARQRRLSVAFRAILMLPALLLAGTLAGGPSFATAGNVAGSAFSYGSGLLHVAAFLGWFAALARARMPRGLRDAATYSLSYGAQYWAYAFLLTDRYPDSDPMAALAERPLREEPIRLELEGDMRRSRLTVFFRALLVAPHVVWLTLWGIAVLFAVILNWLVTLVMGRSPAWLHSFLSAYLRYQFHVVAFLYLIGNPFPGFVGKAGSYPVETVIAPPRRQNRWTVAFRAILVIPALILAATYGSLITVVALLGWFSALVRGRMPVGLRNAGALAQRYQAQTYGYIYLLTDSYPYAGPIRGPSPEEEAEAARAPAPAPSSVPLSELG
jgi:hypothetical protein